MRLIGADELKVIRDHALRMGRDPYYAEDLDAKNVLKLLDALERAESRISRMVCAWSEEHRRMEETLEAWGLETVWGPDFTEESPSMVCLCGHRTLDHMADHVGGTPTYFRGACQTEGCLCSRCKVTKETRRISRAEAERILRDMKT